MNVEKYVPRTEYYFLLMFFIWLGIVLFDLLHKYLQRISEQVQLDKSLISHKFLFTWVLIQRSIEACMWSTLNLNKMKNYYSKNRQLTLPGISTFTWLEIRYSGDFQNQ